MVLTRRSGALPLEHDGPEVLSLDAEGSTLAQSVGSLGHGTSASNQIRSCVGPDAPPWTPDFNRRRLAVAPKLLAVVQAVSREGLRLVLLIRLSPAFPFSLLNLAYSHRDVSLRHTRSA
jgi:hypothetical protein